MSLSSYFYGWYFMRVWECLVQACVCTWGPNDNIEYPTWLSETGSRTNTGLIILTRLMFIKSLVILHLPSQSWDYTCIPLGLAFDVGSWGMGTQVPPHICMPGPYFTDLAIFPTLVWFCDKVSLCSRWWPGTCCIEQVGLELTESFLWRPLPPKCWNHKHHPPHLTSFK